LASCDQGQPQSVSFFPNVEACAAVHEEKACQAARAQAEAMFGAYVPGLAAKEQCETEFGSGNREALYGGQSGAPFVPMFMGFMMDRLPAAPVYRGRDNRALMSSRGKLYQVGRFVGKTGRAATFQAGPISEVRGGDS
ncbi:MAG: DUF1190 domain-containing protein, partial [Rhodospirillales bacterium]